MTVDIAAIGDGTAGPVYTGQVDRGPVSLAVGSFCPECACETFDRAMLPDAILRLTGVTISVAE